MKTETKIFLGILAAILLLAGWKIFSKPSVMVGASATTQVKQPSSSLGSQTIDKLSQQKCPSGLVRNNYLDEACISGFVKEKTIVKDGRKYQFHHFVDSMLAPADKTQLRSSYITVPAMLRYVSSEYLKAATTIETTNNISANDIIDIPLSQTQLQEIKSHCSRVSDCHSPAV